MYIMLCEYWFSCYFLFKLTHKKAEKPKTRKFSGRGDVTSITFFKKYKQSKARHAHPSKGRGKTQASLSKTAS